MKEKIDDIDRKGQREMLLMIETIWEAKFILLEEAYSSYQGRH